jgi:outer membrane protein OmpA-like peptidoglycan-associated protein
MALGRWSVGALALAVGACGANEEAKDSSPVPGGSVSSESAPVTASAARSPSGSSPGRPAFEWVDPEPPGAQALAESVLGDERNRDKTTPLRMSMTTIVGQTTGIGSAASGLAGAASSVEDRLARLGAEITATEIVIRLPGSILFDFDSAALRPDAERTLSELAGVLASYSPRPARVEGHTDSIASDGYNQALSERRAGSVVDWLVAHGVAANRLRAAGHGESRPVADNSTAAGRQSNRRVEVILAKGE